MERVATLSCDPGELARSGIEVETEIELEVETLPDEAIRLASSAADLCPEVSPPEASVSGQGKTISQTIRICAHLSDREVELTLYPSPPLRL